MSIHNMIIPGVKVVYLIINIHKPIGCFIQRVVRAGPESHCLAQHDLDKFQIRQNGERE